MRTSSKSRPTPESQSRGNSHGTFRQRIGTLVFHLRSLPMSDKKTSTQELEEILQELGLKIEELLKKGAEAGAELKDELKKKLSDLKENKTTLEAELQQAKEILEREYLEQKERLEPRLEESKGLFKEGLGQLIEGVKVLFGKSK